MYNSQPQPTFHCRLFAMAVCFTMAFLIISNVSAITSSQIKGWLLATVVSAKAAIWGHLHLNSLSSSILKDSHYMIIVENGLSRWRMKQPKIVDCVSIILLNDPKSQLPSFQVLTDTLHGELSVIGLGALTHSNIGCESKTPAKIGLPSKKHPGVNNLGTQSYKIFDNQSIHLLFRQCEFWVTIQSLQ